MSVVCEIIHTTNFLLLSLVLNFLLFQFRSIILPIYNVYFYILLRSR